MTRYTLSIVVNFKYKQIKLIIAQQLNLINQLHNERFKIYLRSAR